jgi:pimeloyl-ACP methyl ester carboxylesterase
METRTRARRASLVVMAATLAACRGPSGGPSVEPTVAAGMAGTSVGDAHVAEPQRPAGERVTLHTSDGWTLAGEYRPGTGNRVVLLVHQLASNRAEWRPLLARLGAGPSPVGALAIDLRGHGESTAGPDGVTLWTAFGNDREQWAGLQRDVAAAVSFLRTRAPGAEVVLVGSSIGSTAALLHASDDPEVRRVVALSPGLAYRGLAIAPAVEALAQSGRPVLLVAAQGDTVSAEAVAQLGRADPTTRLVTSIVFEGTGAHGVALGAAGVHPELWARIEQWIRAPLPPPAPPAPQSASVDGGTIAPGDSSVEAATRP